MALRSGAYKTRVRLDVGGGPLCAAATERGLEVLRKDQRLAETQRAEKVLAVATSAIREAANSEDFLNQVGREIGVWPRAISGETEAELIHLAAVHSVHLEGQRALVVDIGGGSVELSLGAGHRPRWAVSERLGWYTNDVSTTMIYTHVANTGPRGVKSPLDEDR